MSVLRNLLGIDETDPAQKLADELVRADQQFIEDLVSARRKAGMTQKDVAKALGIEQSSVANVERLGNDPRLSTLRRYALAVEARISHKVTPDAECRESSRLKAAESDWADAWVVTQIAKSAGLHSRVVSKTHSPYGFRLLETFGDPEDSEQWRSGAHKKYA